MPIYCGNNALDSDIVNGTSQLGTRYSCMRKGIGTGLNLPYDAKYAGKYEPIDNRKIYCGNGDNLPEGYDRLGNLSQCLQKGVAIGKRQRALDGDGNINTNNNIIRNLFYGKVKYFLIFILLIVIFLLFYYLKPSIILQKNIENKKIIDWRKFIIIYLILVIPISGFIFVFATV
jgi:hypothetical protein